MVIEGYFVVFGVETELFPGAFEEIAPQALDKTMDNDIRALTNHNTTLVLGRNKNDTAKFNLDKTGLFSSITINPKDSDAVNTHARVERGDVSQCSFGFNIVKEEVEERADGTIKWLITEIDLHEVSVCTFPAYEQTGVQARHADFEQRQEQRKSELLAHKKNQLKEKIKKWH
jgi:HK97 family phage prohead protease